MDELLSQQRKWAVSGSLFDIDKLNDVSKNYLARLGAKTVFNALIAWAKECDRDYYDLLMRDEDFTLGMIAIGRGGEKPRKDISHWAAVEGILQLFL